MTKKEFAVFAAAIKTYYPKEQQLLPNQHAMELWYRELCDIEYNVAEAGLRKWVVNNKWSPSIADIREMVSDVTEGELPDWGSAWDSVNRAIREYGSYKIKEAMESFDDITRQVVERMGFRNLCMSENVAADRANFRMIYEQLAERKRNDQKMPAQLRNVIHGILEQHEQVRLEGGNNESKRLFATSEQD